MMRCGGDRRVRGIADQVAQEVGCEPVARGQHVRGVHEDGHVELLHLAIEGRESRLVKVLSPHVGEYLGAHETQLADASLELIGGGLRLLHG